MAEYLKRYSDNVPGAWYVDEKCILCCACAETAPKNFRQSDSGTHDIVFRQPQNTEENAQCQEAMETCPVEAIGNDGTSEL